MPTNNAWREVLNRSVDRLLEGHGFWLGAFDDIYLDPVRRKLVREIWQWRAVELPVLPQRRARGRFGLAPHLPATGRGRSGGVGHAGRVRLRPVASGYGFRVTEDGVGVCVIGLAAEVRDALNLPLDPQSPATVLNLLLATNNLAHNGMLFDLNADGKIGLLETLVRLLANGVFTAVNERGCV